MAADATPTLVTPANMIAIFFLLAVFSDSSLCASLKITLKSDVPKLQTLVNVTPTFKDSYRGDNSLLLK